MLSHSLLLNFPTNPNPFCHTEKSAGKTGINRYRVGGTDLFIGSWDGRKERSLGKYGI